VFLRYFCRVNDPGPFGTLSLAYYEALRATTIPIRVLATNLASLNVSESRWAPEDLVRPVPKEYLNVVCGDNGELLRLHTIGTPNVAITASWNGIPTELELASLRLYDAVICPTPEETAIYLELGVDLAVHVEAEASILAHLLRGF